MYQILVLNNPQEVDMLLNKKNKNKWNQQIQFAICVSISKERDHSDMKTVINWSPISWPHEIPFIFIIKYILRLFRFLC